MQEIKKLWDSIFQHARGTDDYIELEEKQWQVLENNLSNDDIRCLITSGGTLAPDAGNRGQFVEAVVEFMVATLVKSGDRSNLVKLLSTVCPVYVGAHETVEFYLVMYGSKLSDPILILGDAYFQCQRPRVREYLAVAVHRVFVGHKIPGKDDADYVRNAMNWYEQEKSHLKINTVYPHNDLVYPLLPDAPERYKNTDDPHHCKPLFLRK
jgi:hypothetical protein